MSAEASLARNRAAAAQRPAADPAGSVWVGASAGTGKTKVLTDRVLSLMLHGTAPARILCLTFTKAAAAEMANRLANRLARWTAIKDGDLILELSDLLGRAPDEVMRARARQLFARVLDAPGGMKIQTIHAFCQSLLGRFPLEAGIAPHFQVLDERSAAEMLRAAREEILIDPAFAGEISEVAVHVQEQSFTELLDELARERGRVARLCARPGGIDAAEAAVYRLLNLDLDETPEGVLGTACADEGFDLAGLHRAVQAMLDAGGKKDREHGAVIASWLENSTGRVKSFDLYLGAFFTEGGKGDAFKKLVYKDALAAAPGIDRVLEDEAQRLMVVRTKLNALTVARATAALLRLGTAILAVYDRHKSARALLDYDDLILNARDLLVRQGAASWVLFKLDGGLDHILIDEAQDTNPEQWDVIDMLSAEFFAGAGAREGPRTVFAVGDAKQSIYSFQRADPAAFGRMRAHFAAKAHGAGQGWAKVDLAHSFRSCPAILQVVDAVFAQEAAREGVLFEEAALSHAAVRLGQAGLVELWPPAPAEIGGDPAPWEPPTARRGAAPSRARLARLIAQRIHEWTRAPVAAGQLGPGHEAWLASKGRRLRPGDVLVLVRRRNAFVEELVRELKRLDVPVAGVDRMVLRDQLAVMDLAALGRFLLLPEDDLTLASVLKGPLIGLSEEQLFEIAYDRKSRTLWQSLAEHAERDPAYAVAREHLTDLLARADFVPPYELFAHVLTRDWDGASGRSRLLARLGPDANDPIEEFISLALTHEREHAPSLEGFLHWVEAGAQMVKRDLDMGQDAVRVMTVHGAKGLQAPVVFLPDTLQTPQARKGVFWLESDREGGGEGEGPALWPVRKALDGPVAAHARAEAQGVQDREYRRLLYVALTRAEDRLYVCGWAAQKTPPADCWYTLVEGALSAVGEAADFILGDGAAGGWAGPGWRLVGPQAAGPDGPDAEAARPNAEVQPLPAWACRPPPHEAAPPRPLAPSRPSQAEPAAVSPLGADKSRRFLRGRLIHRLLQSLPDLPRDARRAAAARFLSAGGHGLSAAQQAEIAAVTLTILEDANFAPLFGPGSRAEVPVVGVIGQGAAVEVISGQVDRLVVENDRIRIVDFKTNRPAPAHESEVAPLYRRQMAAYRAVLTEVYPGRQIDCYLLWSDGPLLMHLSDASLAAYAP